MLAGDVFIYKPVPSCVAPPLFVVDDAASLEVTAHASAGHAVKLKIRATKAWAARGSLLKCWPRALSAANQEAEVVFDELHRRLLCHLDFETLAEPIVVEAVPGAGKTTLLMQVARRQPHLRFQLLTFSRNLAEEAKARCPSNVFVQTLDQVCYRRHARPEEPCGSLTDERLGRALWPRCQPWQKKRGVHGLGECVEAALSSVSPPRFCAYHSETASYALAEAQKRAELQSFAGLRRCQYMTSESFVRPGDADVLLVDELQDLERQMQEILWRWSGPMVCVGDRRQQIYGFRSSSMSCGCSFDSANAWPQEARQLNLYQSFRLCPVTTALIRNVFDVGISTALLPGVVRRQASWPSGPSCVLFRTNAELLVFASKHPEAGVVGQARMLAQFLAAKSALSSRVPWERGDPWRTFLSKCSKSDLMAFEEVLRDETREAALSASAVRQIAATAHSSKGSEHARVVVSTAFLELAQSNDAESRNIAFVALSRHLSELVLVETADSPETSASKRRKGR